MDGFGSLPPHLLSELFAVAGMNSGPKHWRSNSVTGHLTAVTQLLEILCSGIGGPA
jgi:hypothetical protein